VVERIRLSDKYNIPDWLSSAYAALLNRSPGELSAEEAEVLGSDRVAFLYKAKCSMHQEHSKKASQSPMNKGIKENQTQKKSNQGSILMWFFVLLAAFLATKVSR
jgi:hypothetical protein